jgi:glucose-1-phosphate adenylyltransferase
MLEKTISVILAGGIGSRLNPLTADRAKPAVPFGGRYRIIDFTLSNCLHSGLRQILVLTQYKSHSLQKHLRDGWSVYNPELGEYITPVPPQMRTGESAHHRADAIHQNLYLLERSGAEWVMILAGDHIYRMDYAAMLNYHRDSGADATVACLTVGLDEARSFGVIMVDADDRITSFREKPEHPGPPGDPEHALASMGVYVFPVKLLIDLLRRDNAAAGSTYDFGKDILPTIVPSHRVVAYRFGGMYGRPPIATGATWERLLLRSQHGSAETGSADRSVPGDWPIRT